MILERLIVAWIGVWRLSEHQLQCRVVLKTAIYSTQLATLINSDVRILFGVGSVLTVGVRVDKVDEDEESVTFITCGSGAYVLRTLIWRV
mgnify:CR=1 FL=1